MARNMCLLSLVIAWNLLHVTLSEHTTNIPEDYCQYETFQPRCLKNEIIRMESATYGRMRVGRCITAAEVDEQKTLSGDVSRFLGCSADVLPLLDKKCSGKIECDIRVIDMSLVKATPCFPGLNVYLEVSYDCINVADDERSCSALASVIPTHIIGFTDESNRICGTTSQPWRVDAPHGQKIRISLLDFRASTSGQSFAQARLPCNSYGVIMDEASKRNITICGGRTEREMEMYTSTGNVVEIFLNPPSQTVDGENRGQFLLKVEVITVVAVAGFTLTVCLAILCTGIVCLRRFSSKGKKKQDYNTLAYHINSAQRQQRDHRIFDELTIDVAGNDACGTNMQQAPTYSVFVNESGYSDAGHNHTN